MFRLEIKSKNKSNGSSLNSYKYISRYYKELPNSIDLVKEKSHIPKCYENKTDFWKAVDELEIKNGNLYREMLISVPRELNSRDLNEVLPKFIKRTLGDSTPYSYGVHTHKASDGEDNLHVHLMFYNKKIPLEYFKNKDLDFNKTFKKVNKEYIPKYSKYSKKEFVYRVRKEWERAVNNYLGYNAISEKNLKREVMEMYGFKFKDIRNFAFDKNMSGAKLTNDIKMLIDKENKGLADLKEFLFERTFINIDRKLDDFKKQAENKDKNFVIKSENKDEFKELIDVIKELDLGYKGNNLISNLIDDFTNNVDIDVKEVRDICLNEYIGFNNKHDYINDITKKFEEKFPELEIKDNFNKYLSEVLAQEIKNTKDYELFHNEIKDIKDNKILIKDFRHVNGEFKKIIDKYTRDLKEVSQYDDVNYRFYDNLKDGIYNELCYDKNGTNSVKEYLNRDYLKNFTTSATNYALSNDGLSKIADTFKMNNFLGVIKNISSEDILKDGGVNYYGIMFSKFKNELLEAYTSMVFAEMIDSLENSVITFKDFIDLYKDDNDLFKMVTKNKLTDADINLINSLVNEEGGTLKNYKFNEVKLEGDKRSELIDDLSKHFKDRTESRNFLKRLESAKENIFNTLKGNIKSSYGITDNFINNYKRLKHGLDLENFAKTFMIGRNDIKVNNLDSLKNSRLNYLSKQNIRETLDKNSFTTNGFYKMYEFNKEKIKEIAEKLESEYSFTKEELFKKFIIKEYNNRYDYSHRLKEHLEFNTYTNSTNVLPRKLKFYDGVNELKKVVFSKDDINKVANILSLEKELSKGKNKIEMMEFYKNELSDLYKNYDNLERDLEIFNSVYESLEKDLKLTNVKEKNLFGEDRIRESNNEYSELALKLLMHKTDVKKYREYDKEVSNVLRLNERHTDTVMDEMYRNNELLLSIQKMNELKEKTVDEDYKKKQKISSDIMKQMDNKRENKVNNNTDRLNKKVFVLKYIDKKIKTYYDSKKDLGKEDLEKLDRDKRMLLEFMRIREQMNSNMILQQLMNAYLEEKKKYAKLNYKTLLQIKEIKEKELSEKIQDIKLKLDGESLFNFKNGILQNDEELSEKFKGKLNELGREIKLNSVYSINDLYNVLQNEGIKKKDVGELQEILRDSDIYVNKINASKYSIMKEFNDKYVSFKDLEGNLKFLENVYKVMDRGYRLETDRRKFDDKGLIEGLSSRLETISGKLKSTRNSKREDFKEKRDKFLINSMK